MRRQLASRELTAEGPRRGQPPKPGGRSITVNLAESPLAWLHARGHLDDRLFDASERLRADYERASLGPSVTMRWDAVRTKGSGDSGLNSTEHQIAAKARFDGAMAAAGSGLSPTCCGGFLVPARACLMQKRSLRGPHAAASWCSIWHWNGWPIITG